MQVQLQSLHTCPPQMLQGVRRLHTTMHMTEWYKVLRDGLDLLNAIFVIIGLSEVVDCYLYHPQFRPFCKGQRCIKEPVQLPQTVIDMDIQMMSLYMVYNTNC